MRYSQVPFLNAVRFVKKSWLSRLSCALAGILILTGHAVFCADGNPPEKPGTDGVTPITPDSVPKPNTDPTPNENALEPLLPRPATFSDYIPEALNNSAPTRLAYPIVENPVSPLANALVRNTSNEGIFQQGAGPKSGTINATELAGDVPFLHSGPFGFRTTMTVENYLDDNFFGSVTHPRTSWLRNYNPGFSASYRPNSQTSVDAFYDFTLHDYSTNVERDYYDETAGVTIKVRHFGVDGLTFSLSDLYNQIGNTIINPLASTFDVRSLEFQTGARYETNSLPVGFKYVVGALTLEAIYSYDIIHYFGQLNKASDAQQNTETVRGSYNVSPGHFTIFGESNINDTRLPNASEKDFDFVNFFVGVRGRFENLTYQVKTGYSAFDQRSTGTVSTRPLLAADVRYEYSRRLDINLVGNRSMEYGVQTGRDKIDAYGGVINIRPMLRGTLMLSHVWQDTNRTASDDKVETTELNYRHLILNWLEPRLGMKYSIEKTGELIPKDRIWTGLTGIGFKLQPRARADLDYYHEDRDGLRRLITDRVTAGYTYKFNHYSTGTFGYDHAFRRDPSAHGNIKINELRLGVSLSW